MIEVAERYIYPVKSMAGFLLPDNAPMVIGPEGVEGSRRWMVIDDNNEPVTARQYGMQAMLGLHPIPIGGDDFILGDTVVEATEEGPVSSLEIFMDGMQGRECSPAGTVEVQKRLDRKDIRLVHFEESAGRVVHPDKYWKGLDPRAFVDGAQITAYSHDTAKELQIRFPEYDADPRRIRPDLVVHGTRPFEEYSWVDYQAKLAVGSAAMRADRAIDRCLMPNYHPDTLERTKVFSQMIAQELKMEIPDPKASAVGCFSIGLHIVKLGVIPAHAPVTLLG